MGAPGDAYNSITDEYDDGPADPAGTDSFANSVVAYYVVYTVPAVGNPWHYYAQQ
jgi:hypothetical protein